MPIDRPMWRSRAWSAAFVLLATLAVVLVTTGFGDAASLRASVAVALAITTLVIVWAVRSTRVQRRDYDEDLTAWAAERAAQAERLTIARDLHDLVSHGLGLITLRAAAVRTLTGPDGEAERDMALADIENASRQTVTELRRMLTVLRAPGQAPLRPADTLRDLPAIVQAADGAGLNTSLDAADLGDVSPVVQLTICAVVREALNNTIRHAGPVNAAVRVHRESDTIVIDIQDPGPRPGWRPQPGAGHGLDGLRDRVTVLEGTVSAAPIGTGWRLTARIPDAGQR